MKPDIVRTEGAPVEVLAPVNRREEVAPLLAAGATWLYGGCVPESWKERYPATVLLNQRTFASAQFGTLEELAEAVAAAHAGGGRFALTLNAPFYMDSQLAAALEMARFAQHRRIDAFIVADPGLIVALRRAGIRTPLHLSTMGMASNAAAVRMYRGLGVERFILPRHLSLSDIGDMVRAAPEATYEAFLLVGKCPNIEGVCSFVHDSPDGRWPCEWAYTITDRDMGPAPSDVVCAVDGVRLSDRRDSCGLCALPELLAAGVRCFKIVGRGAPLGRKVRLVAALVQALGQAGKAGEGWGGRCRQAYRELFNHSCTAHNCYYPDAVRAWGEGRETGE